MSQMYTDSEIAKKENSLHLDLTVIPNFTESGNVQNGINLVYDRDLSSITPIDLWVSANVGVLGKGDSSDNFYGTITAKWLESKGTLRLEGNVGLQFQKNTVLIYFLAGIRYHLNDGLFLRASYSYSEGIGLGVGGLF